MQIQPRSEEEIQRDMLCPEGFWPFTVLASKEQASKSQKNQGKMMFAVKVNVHTDDGDSHVYDYFADWFNAHKLRHFCVATGKIGDYEDGNLDGADNAFQGLTGYLQIKIKKDKQTGEPRNEIVDYLTEAEYAEETKGDKPEAQSEKPKLVSNSAPTDVPDDVPF